MNERTKEEKKELMDASIEERHVTSEVVKVKWEPEGVPFQMKHHRTPYTKECASFTRSGDAREYPNIADSHSNNRSSSASDSWGNTSSTLATFCPFQSEESEGIEERKRRENRGERGNLKGNILSLRLRRD